MTVSVSDECLAFRIGDWIIRTETNTAERDGEILRLEARAVAVLAYLHHHHGRVVSKDELLDAVWQRSAISDHSVAVVISDLRRSLGDDSRAPRYIRTVPRKGYTLIAASETLDRLPPSPVPGLPKIDPPATHILLDRRMAMIALGIAALVLVSIAAIQWGLLSLTGSLDAAVEPPDRRPFTTLEGRPVQPAFSPDGGQVAFAWNNDQMFEFDIYVKALGSEAMTRLTESAGYESNPVWSPQGNRIAYLHRLWSPDAPPTCSVNVMSSVGGNPRLVGNCSMRRLMGLSWFPDGQHLTYPALDEDAMVSRLEWVNIETLERGILTAPPLNSEGDDIMAVSPDGRRIAFRRIQSGMLTDLYVLELGPDRTPSAEPVRLTFDKNYILDIDWTPDGQHILFTSSRAGPFSLWKVSPSGGDPVEVIKTSTFVHAAAISPDGKTLILDQRDEATNIAVGILTPPGTQAPSSDAATNELRFVTRSTRFEIAPAFSPDGTRIAFISDRTGSTELWTAQADGSAERQLTHFDVTTDAPTWSPDGETLLFASQVGDGLDLFVMPADGGVPERLTSDPATDTNPMWSADGRTIYFTSDRTGQFDIWALDLASRDIRQITVHGGWVVGAGPSPDELYFVKRTRPGLWRIDLSRDNRETRVTPETFSFGKHSWKIIGDHLYYLDHIRDAEEFALMRRPLADVSTPNLKDVIAFRFPRAPYDGTIDIDAEARTVLYAAGSRYQGQLYQVELTR